MVNQRVIILGGGGHSINVLEIMTDSNGYIVDGFVDADPSAQLSNEGIKWLGSDSDLDSILVDYKLVHIGFGQIKSPNLRRSCFHKVKMLGSKVVTLVARTACVSKSVFIDEGALISHNAVINRRATIGKNSIVNTGAIIEHGAAVGDHCHIAPGAIVLGDAVIGSGTFVGAGAIVCQGSQVAPDSFIRAKELVSTNVL